MNKQLPIGILDSGVGGLTAVVQMTKQLPNESIIYFGDSKRMPYGNREKEEIVDLANRMIAYLETLGVKAILLACNTISSQFAQLKSTVPLFSIVDAGSRAVCDAEESGSVGVIATCATVNSGIYEQTIHTYNPNIRVVSNSSASLPKIIDSQMEHNELLDAPIRECIDPIVREDASMRYLLLGCSHFPIIKREIGALYPNLTFVDPAKAQVSLLKEYLTEHEMQTNSSVRRIDLYTTAETYEYAAAIKRLKLEINGLLKVQLLADDD